MSNRSAADEIEALLAEVSRLAVHLRGRNALAESGNGFSGGVAGVLQALGVAGPHTVPEIARRRSTSRQNIQVVVNRLKNTGLVELEGNPAHRRSVLVRLTDRGKAALSEIQKAEGRRRESLLTKLSEEDVVSATRVLSQVREALARPAGNDTESGKEDAMPVISAKRARGAIRRRPSQGVLVIENSAPDDEEFPVSLL